MMAEQSWQGRGGTRQVDAARLALELAIQQTVAYADIFDYPLTAAEVHRYLVGVPASPTAVRARLTALVASGRLLRHERYYTLRGRGALVEVRRRRARLAARLWPDGIRYGRILAQLPFVRMVAVTGSLAVDNVESDSDVDYLLVTAAGRVWIGQGMAGIVRHLTLRRRVKLCPNYVLSEQALILQDRNLYTAHELVQMVPIAGHAVHRRMLALNPWTGTFLPNSGSGPSRPIAADVARHRIVRLAEAALSTPIGSWLDGLQRERIVRKTRPVTGHLAEVLYSRECCKSHQHAHGQRVLRAFEERLDQARAVHA